MPKCLSNSASGFIRRHNNITKRKKAIIKNKKNMKRLLTILAAVVMSNALVWADKRAEGDALYEKFAHWGFESKADSILAGRDAALTFFADNHQWEHYYYVANLAIQVHMLHEDNPSACLRECQQLYKFATDHRHAYGLASVQAQMGWIYGYLGDHQEAVRLLKESIENIRRQRIENRDVLGIYYIYVYMLELVGNYDEQQRIIDEGKRIGEKLNISETSPEAAQLLSDELLNVEALMLVHRGQPEKARSLIEKIAGRLRDGKEKSVYEAWRAIAEYHLACGEYTKALEATQQMELQLANVNNSGLQWGLNLLRTEILRHLGRSDEAYDTLRQMMELRSTQTVSQLRRQLSEMDSLYQIDEMRIREQKSHFWYAVIISLIVIIALAVFTFFRIRTARVLSRKNQELADALGHAQESDRMKTVFVQHISHEIRTPLNIITGFAQVISNPEYDITEEDRNRMLFDICHNTNEITNLINELLELSESESQSHYSKTDDVDIAALCRSVIAECESENPAKLQLLLESSLPDGFTLKSNAAAIQKILSRLMNNALKFTEHGSVTMKLGIQNEGVKIEIEDTGIGIPPEHQQKIFERFYKVDTFKQGIGLGLTVARRTAELLDGTLSLDSTYTTGARFVLTLPQ